MVKTKSRSGDSMTRQYGDERSKVFRRLCCKAPPPPRPELNPVCIGLTEAGKTTILSQICGHSLEDIKPTTGFEIKACQFKTCILNVKEIGGGEKIRPFWKHYYNGADGIIFVLDSSCSEDDMEKVHQALHTALEDPQLFGKPCLILGNCQDKNGARNLKELEEALDVDVLSKERKISVALCQMDNLEKIREGFDKFIQNLLGTAEEETGKSEPEDQGEINRI